MSKVLAALIAMLSLTACKTPGNAGSEVKAQAVSRPSILVVGIGGWKSCEDFDPFNQKIADSLKNLTQDLANNADADFLLACLHNVTPAKQVANLWYTGGKLNGQVYKIKARDFPANVNSYITQTRPDQVYIVGHSYGGWVAYRLAEAGVKSDAVFGLDPIDAADCVPGDNFFLGLGIESSDCKHHPELNYNQIRSSTKKLYNFWQPLGPIHSTAVPGAVNQEFDINHPSFNGDPENKVTYAHRMIGSESTAWGAICHEIFSANGWDTSGCHTIVTNGEGKFAQFVTVNVPELEDIGQVSPGDGDDDNNGGGGGDGGQDSDLICGQASQNTKVCINQASTVVSIINGGIVAQYAVQQKQNSTLMPGGVAHIGVANLAHIQGFSPQTMVSFVVHPNGTGRLYRNVGGQWAPFGAGATFQLTGMTDNGGGSPDIGIDPNGGNNGGSGPLCGQATANTKVCIDPSRSAVTLIRNATGQKTIYGVLEKKPSQQLPGATAHYGVADLAHIPGMSSQQQVSFIIHPDGYARLVYMTPQGWVPFGNVASFPVQEE